MIRYRIFAGTGVDQSENFATRLLRGKAWLDNGSSHWDRTTAVSKICETVMMNSFAIHCA